MSTELTRRSAARAGVQTGDVILSVNDKDVASISDVAKALESIQPGHTARVLVYGDQYVGIWGSADGSHGGQMWGKIEHPPATQPAK